MLTIFAMTSRGHKVIAKIIAEQGSTFVKQVICARDKNIENDYYEDIKKLCAENSIPFKDRKDSDTIETPYALAVGWRWLENLSSNTKLIIFHDSLLPKYRGFAPLVNSLINEETEIGVSALFAAKEYDKGDIIYRSKTTIEYPIKIRDAIDVNNRNYEECCSHICELIKHEQQIVAVKQDEQEATYSLWRDEDDYRINWNKSSRDIKRFVDATGFPYSGATTFMEQEKLRVLDGEIWPDKSIVNRDVGKVIEIIDEQPVIVCGSGLFRITEAYFDNNKTVSALPLKKFRTRLQ